MDKFTVSFSSFLTHVLIALTASACSMNYKSDPAQSSNDSKQLNRSGASIQYASSANASGTRAPENPATPIPTPIATAEPTAEPTLAPTAVPVSGPPSCGEFVGLMHSIADSINDHPLTYRMVNLDSGAVVEAGPLAAGSIKISFPEYPFPYYGQFEYSAEASANTQRFPGRLNFGASTAGNFAIYICNDVYNRAGRTSGECSQSSPNYAATIKATGFPVGSNSAALRYDAPTRTISQGWMDGTIAGQYISCGADLDPNNSPLVIEKTSGGGIQTLDPKSTRTFFDLTGNGLKDRISCIRNGAYLALPDANGKVTNIDQLFGNNTRGPDGLRNSANGFEALGKHDLKGEGSEGYGTLTIQDPVFQDLRLWEDKNCDGVAQLEELSPLSAWDIKAIHWKSYEEMMEIDPFGNQTRERSVVELGHASSFLTVFDLWFKMGNGVINQRNRPARNRPASAFSRRYSAVFHGGS